MVEKKAFALKGLAVAVAVATTTTTTGISAQQPFKNLKLNEVQHLGTHNSYHKYPDQAILDVSTLFDVDVGGNPISPSSAWEYEHSSLSEQLLSPSFVKHLEIDVYYDDTGIRYQNKTGLSLAGQLGVPMPAVNPKTFRVMHVSDMDYNSNCDTLGECVEQVNSYLSGPGLDDLPLIVMIEYKDTKTQDPLTLGFAEPYSNTGAALGELILQLKYMFGVNKIYKPSELIAAAGTNGTLQQAVMASGWPTLEALKGKVILVLQGDSAKSSYSATYSSNPDTDILFTLQDSCDHPLAAFVQFSGLFSDGSKTAAIQDCLSKNMMLRVQVDANTYEARTGDLNKFQFAKDNGIQMLSTDFLAEYNTSNQFNTNYGVAMAPKCNEALLTQSVCDTYLRYASQPALPTVTSQTVNYPSNYIADYQAIDPNDVFSGQNNQDFVKIIEKWIEIANLTSAIDGTPAYNPPTYKPAGFVSSMHNVPRLVGSNDFSYEGDEGTSYLIGVGLVIGVLFVVFLLLGIIGCAYSSCGCCASKKKAGQRINNFQTILTVIILGIFLAGIGLFAYGVVSMDKAVDEYLDISLQFQNRLASMREFVDDTKVSIANVGAASQSIVNTCAALSSIGSITSETDKFEDVAGDSIQQIADGEIFISDTRELLDKYSSLMVLISYCVLGVFGGFTFVYALFLILRKKCPGKAVSRIFGFVLNPFIFLLIIVFGFLFAAIFGLNILIADVCTDPDNVIIDAINDPLIQYYVNCNGNNTILDEVQAFIEQTHIFKDGGVLINLSPGICGDTSTIENAQRQMNVITDEMYNLYGDLQNLRDNDLSCQAINPLYVQTVHQTSCETVGEASLFLWIGGLLVAFFGAALLICVGYQTRNYNKTWWDESKDSADQMAQLPSRDAMGTSYGTDEDLAMARYNSEENNSVLYDPEANLDVKPNAKKMGGIKVLPSPNNSPNKGMDNSKMALNHSNSE